MATSTTNTNFDPALKQIYRDSYTRKLTFRRRPLFGLLPKFEGFGGRNMPIVLQYGNPQGRSRTFANAQSNRTQVLVEDFVLTRANNYAVSTIDGETIESTRENDYAFLSALKLKIDSTMASLADDLESSFFRSTDGNRGQIASVTAADPMVITLSQPEEATLFEVNMTLVADNASGGGSLRTAPGTANVDGVDRASGTITTDYDNGCTTTDWAAADYLFVQGDESLGTAGLIDWVPDAAPSATLFFGVDRSSDTRLGGLRQSSANDNLEEAAIDAQSKAATQGGMPDLFVVHNAQVRRFVKELGAKKEYVETHAVGPDGMPANVGYRSLIIQGDEGPIAVVASNKCQANRGWMLQRDTWSLNTLYAPVRVLADDGLRILRQASADGYEVRMGHRGNIGCNAPIWNVNVTLATPDRS